MPPIIKGANGKWGVVNNGAIEWFGYPWAATSYALYLRSKWAEAEVKELIAA